MSDVNAVNADASIFRMHTSSAERTMSNARSGLQRDTQTDADLDKASREFESLLLNFMIREMRATVPESALFPESMAEEIFTGMLDEKISAEMAQNGGIGISRMIFEQLNNLK
jgi:flagellar protein FlgJ